MHFLFTCTFFFHSQKWSIPAGITSYTEGRLKAPTNKGSLPAFWLLGDGTNSDGNGWPITGEVDILEFANNAYEATSPYFSLWYPSDVYTNPPGTWLSGTHDTHPDSFAKRPDLVNSWHTWGLYRSPQKMELRIDGQLIATFLPNVVYRNGYKLPPMLFTNNLHIRFSYGMKDTCTPHAHLTRKAHTPYIFQQTTFACTIFTFYTLVHVFFSLAYLEICCRF